jgi:aminoglycoside 3-N-acetyltransferase
VLMIGVDYWAFTGFHLAEYRYTPSPPMRQYACVVATADGGRRWEEYVDVVLDDQKFEDIGRALEKKVAVKRAQVGRAPCRLMSLQTAVEFAAEWMGEHRR